MKRNFYSIFFLAFLFFLSACSSKVSQKKAKYVFLFIGDGMSINQVYASNYYKELSKNKGINFTNFTYQGITNTKSKNSKITDSAAGGTAIACGKKTVNSAVGVDSSKNNKLESLAFILKKKNWRIGIASNVSLDHATPASFYAHSASRKHYFEIAKEISESNFEYFAGGGLLKPQKNAISQNVYSNLKEKGYNIIYSKDSVKYFSSDKDKIILQSKSLDAEKSFFYSIDEQKKDLSLQDITRKGIDFLYNKSGFFMMIEGGKIDWACHSNDGATAIKEVLDFEKAIDEALNFYKKHPNETLIIVTADHECGGMSLGCSKTGYKLHLELLKYQNISNDAFSKKMISYIKMHKNKTPNLNNIKPIISKHFGLWFPTKEKMDNLLKRYKKGEKQLKDSIYLAVDADEERLLKEALILSYKKKKITKKDANYMKYGRQTPISQAVISILNSKAGLGWTSFSHTGIPVITFAKGVGAESFNGNYENSELKSKILKSCGF